MAKYTNTFVLSDETYNSHECRIKTAGIDLERFKKNPVMFLNHDHDEIIGRWENIRVEGVKLLADAVFDTRNPKGAEIQRQVNEGFIRSVSVGIISIETEKIGDELWVTKSELVECSVVTIPSNPNALRSDYLDPRKGQKLCFTFGANNCNFSAYYEKNNVSDKELKSTLLTFFNLPKNATNSDILKKMWQELGQSEMRKIFSDLSKIGVLDENEISRIVRVFSNDPALAREMIEEKINENKAKIHEIVGNAVNDHLILWQDMAFYENIGQELGAKKLRELIRVTPKPMRAIDVISGGKDHDKKNWGLKEWRTYEPETLAKDPKLYDFLVEKERLLNGIGGGHKDLNWYRKNAPQELEKDKSLFNRLLAEEKAKGKQH